MTRLLVVRRVILGVAVLALAAACNNDTTRGAASPASVADAQTRGDAVQGELDDWTSQGPGGVTVAMARGGDLRLYASGDATPDGRAMRSTDQLRVGSISKTFVATMLLQLVDEDALDLDDPVTRHAPRLTVADGVTIRQLLGHTSGIPEHTDQRLSVQLLADMNRTWTADEVLALVADRPRDFAPGERHTYSNTNYVVAGLLLEEVTEMSLAENLRTRITEPLGLTDTYFAPDQAREPVAGFSPSLPGGDTTSAYRAIETAAGAAGALVSTAPDLAEFLGALADGRLLSPGALNAMTRDVATEQFGLGVFPSGLPSGGGFGNGGAIPGFAAFMGTDPETGDLFVILTNDDHRSLDDLATQLIAAWS